MKLILAHNNKIALSIVLLLAIGILSTYFNWGAISVIASVLLPVLFFLNTIIVIYAFRQRKYLYLFSTMAFLLCYNFFYQISLDDENHKNTISLLTYNVRSFANEDAKVANNIIKFIDSINPDILLLQESAYKVGRNIKGYDYHFLGFRKDIEKTLLDVYSKFPIVEKGYVDFPNTRNNTLYTDLVVENDTLRVYNVHLQSFALTSRAVLDVSEKLSYTFSKQIEQSKAVKAHANKSNRKVIISGDFNATQFSIPYKTLSHGLNDSFFAKGNGLGTTYNLSGFPLRLDYILLNKSLEVTNHKNFDLNLSDHKPILIEFKIPKTSRS
ncbi:endonuclease/exonuclease/phosphatase family protein [Winogradskyella sp.]|uniref:endonuclease/exonuclease/phosphatase family protein n=1 Tax=Winogradskyella sp. TaxID=1883156 RepID=UPI0026230F22|nr:endonuclease/exonuclease/phosphatase family protein [Winogradskyella sp.]